MTMYKVILVDDDYPVLETLSEVIDWEKAGCRLQGLYENGLAAMQAVADDLPDIVITDIGMPKMNGIELVRELKALKPDIRTIIVTCHDEFEFAKQALQLNVHEYLLKETLDPDDLNALLHAICDKLDSERRESEQVDRLQKLAQRHRTMLRQQFIRQFLQQPLLHQEAWAKEAKEFGIEFADGFMCLPLIATVNNYQSVKLRFVQEDTLMFAISNVNDEVLRESEQGSAIQPSTDRQQIRVEFFLFNAKCSFLLFFYRRTLSMNIFAEARQWALRLQAAMHGALKLSMSFVIGKESSNPLQLQKNMKQLVDGTKQRFYMDAVSVHHVESFRCSTEDLFEHYDRAMSEMREALSSKQEEKLRQTVARWMSFIKEGRYEPETVKDWVLKLVLDMKLKFHSLRFFRRDDTADILHKEAADLDALHEVQQWLTDHLLSLQARMDEWLVQSRRSEIQRACRYVENNLDKRITLDEVAGHLHLNASYFSRLFRKENGETFIEYVTRMKMNRAKEMLDQTTYSVGTICEMLGYDNQSYFIKTFKGVVGVTPSEYRGRTAASSI